MARSEIKRFEVIGKNDKGHDVLEVEFRSGITFEFTSKELNDACKEYKTYLLNQEQKEHPKQAKFDFS
jgi:hypothetical protein